MLGRFVDAVVFERLAWENSLGLENGWSVLDPCEADKLIVFWVLVGLAIVQWCEPNEEPSRGSTYVCMHQSRTSPHLSLLLAPTTPSYGASLLPIHSPNSPLCLSHHFRRTSIRYFAVSAILSKPHGRGGFTVEAKVAPTKQMLQLHVLAKTAI